jgi:hypothetical protein
MTCEKATPSAASAQTPATEKTASSSQFLGQPMPKKSRPASTTITTCTNAFDTALAATPPR